MPTLSSMDKPSVSIVVPVFNRENLIVRCLDSIFNQSVRPDEVVVVDNDSSDATYDVAKKWIEDHGDSGIRLKLLRQPLKGACPARQRGLENAEADFVCFFDSDDVMRPELVEEAISKIKENPDADIICWPVTINLLNGAKRTPPFMPQNPIEGHLFHTLLRPQGYMARREFIERGGGWSKNIPVWNDLELGLRLLLLNPKIAAVNEIMADIFAQETSITGKSFSSKEGLWEQTLDEMQAIASRTSNVEREKILKLINYKRAILGAIYYRENNKKGAKKLIKEALGSSGSLKEKLLLNLSYHYSKFGFRGIWRLYRLL